MFSEKARAPRLFRRFVFLAAAGILAVVLTACTGRGGGQLPPDDVLFTGPASFGFDFSCEDKGGLNPSTGELNIQLSYSDKGTNPIGSGSRSMGPSIRSTPCSNPPSASARIHLPAGTS